MNVMAVICARALSEGLPNKNTLMLCGKPAWAYSYNAATKSELVNKIVVSTDDKEILDKFSMWGTNEWLCVIDRPKKLSTAEARIDDVLRHAVSQVVKNGDKPDYVVLLYANVPVRADGIIDKAVKMCIDEDADSVQTVVEGGKFNPMWSYHRSEDGQIYNNYTPHVGNYEIAYRRQQLPKVYYPDGGVGVIKITSLLSENVDVSSDDPHAFWGKKRYGLVQGKYDTVEIDTEEDLKFAEMLLETREKEEREKNRYKGRDKRFPEDFTEAMLRTRELAGGPP